LGGGFRVAFLVGAIRLMAGVVLLGALVRGRDVPRIEASGRRLSYSLNFI
jgi:hypothetical protein